MSAIYSHPLFIKLRSVLRNLGLTKLLARLLPNRSYEERFDQALINTIEPGFVIWDIGANVGLYTKKFAELVGAAGSVHAFEPSTVNFAKLSEAVQQLSNVKVYNCALGDEEKMISMIQGDDQLGATSRVSLEADGSIKMRTANELLNTGLPAPNLVKIDVEGFEAEVLNGFLQTGPLPAAIQYFAIEIHFRLLQDRGIPNAPKEIERKLKASGFDVNWVDASHILATRV